MKAPRFVLCFAVLMLVWSTAMAFQGVPSPPASAVQDLQTQQTATQHQADMNTTQGQTNAVQSQTNAMQGQMTSAQTFYLQMVLAVMPLVMLIGTWFVGRQVKQGQALAAADREAKAAENREITAHVTAKIDGVKDEMLAASRAAPFFTGLIPPPETAPEKTPTQPE